MTDDKAKLYVLDDAFRMNAEININEADKETLMYIMDEETADKILDKRQEVGRFNTREDIKGSMDEKLYERVKKQLKIEGQSRVSVVEFVKERIEKAQKRIEGGILEKPADWIFFVSNMIGLAVIAEEYLIKTHDIKLIGSKWQNLVDLAVKIDVGHIQYGSKEINYRMQIGKLYEALGISAGYVRVVSKDDATMVAILEAAVMKVKGTAQEGNAVEEGVLFGPGADNSYLVKKVKVEVSGDIMATALDVDGETVKIGAG